MHALGVPSVSGHYFDSLFVIHAATGHD